MAKVTIKSRSRYKLDLNKQEINTLTIALALLDIETMETEAKEQGLAEDMVEYDHLSLFKTLSDITNLYPQVQLEEEES